MACFRLVTFFPDRPDLSFPRFISCIARSTLRPERGPYFRPDFFDELLRAEVFFRPRDDVLDVDFFRVADVFRVVAFFLVVAFFRDPDVLRRGITRYSFPCPC